MDKSTATETQICVWTVKLMVGVDSPHCLLMYQYFWVGRSVPVEGTDAHPTQGPREKGTTTQERFPNSSPLFLLVWAKTSKKLFQEGKCLAIMQPLSHIPFPAAHSTHLIHNIPCFHTHLSGSWYTWQKEQLTNILTSCL